MEEFVRRKNQSTRSGIREAVEVALGLGGVTGLNWLIPVSWRPSHLLFCTFFLVVFAIAVRYHTIAAYSASLLAALAYALLLWLRPEIRAQSGLFYLALEPCLLLSSGICASDLLRWQRQRLDTLEQRYSQIETALRKTQQRYETALKMNEALEQQVAGLPTSLATISEKIMGLWKMDERQRYSAILDLLISALEAQSGALYLPWSGSWHLYTGQPREGVHCTPVLDASDPLIKRVIESREVSTIRDVLSLREKQNMSPESAVMAGPLLNRAGEIAGMVVIDHISLLKFTPGTVRLFRSLLHMASLSLQTARSRAEATDLNLALTNEDLDPTEPALPVLSGSGNILS